MAPDFIRRLINSSPTLSSPAASLSVKVILFGLFFTRTSSVILYRLVQSEGAEETFVWFPLNVSLSIFPKFISWFITLMLMPQLKLLSIWYSDFPTVIFTSRFFGGINKQFSQSHNFI